MGGEPDQRGEVPTGRLPGDPDPAGVEAQLVGVVPQPADRRLRVVQLGGERRLAGVPVLDRRDRQAGVEQLLEELARAESGREQPAVPGHPRAAVHPHHDRRTGRRRAPTGPARAPGSRAPPRTPRPGSWRTPSSRGVGSGGGRYRASQVVRWTVSVTTPTAAGRPPRRRPPPGRPRRGSRRTGRSTLPELLTTPAIRPVIPPATSVDRYRPSTSPSAVNAPSSTTPATTRSGPRAVENSCPCDGSTPELELGLAGQLGPPSSCRTSPTAQTARTVPSETSRSRRVPRVDAQRQPAGRPSTSSRARTTGEQVLLPAADEDRLRRRRRRSAASRRPRR